MERKMLYVGRNGSLKKYELYSVRVYSTESGIVVKTFGPARKTMVYANEDDFHGEWVEDLFEDKLKASFHMVSGATANGLVGTDELKYILDSLDKKSLFVIETDPENALIVNGGKVEFVEITGKIDKFGGKDE